MSSLLATWILRHFLLTRERPVMQERIVVDEEHQQNLHILSFLRKADEMERARVRNNESRSPYWRFYKRTERNPSYDYPKYAKQLADDVSQYQTNPDYISIMFFMYTWMLTPCNRPNEFAFNFHLNFLLFQLGVSELPGSVLGALLAMSTSYLPVLLLMVTAYLATTCGQVVYKRMSGRISEQRCALDCVKNGAEILCGALGAAAGGGLPFIPYIIGCVLGGILGGRWGNLLVDYVAEVCFRLPKNETLENAYGFLEVAHIASNDEVNEAFRKRCQRCHPEKGGSAENYYTLIHSIRVVQMSRNL